MISFNNSFLIANIGITHYNNEVKEAALRCFEIWERIESLDILKSFNKIDNDNYIKQYLNNIINDIENMKKETENFFNEN